MQLSEGLSKAIYELKLALRAARHPLGLKADLYYIIASLMSRPVTLSVAGYRVTMSKYDVGSLIIALAGTVRGPYVNDDYLDFELNYFGKRYVLGFPLEYMKDYGRLYLLSDAKPLPSLRECKPMSFECPYYVGDLTGAEVLDIGGYIDDAALYFYALGAKHVKVYEPFFYEAARRNLKVNGLPDDVEPYAVGFKGLARMSSPSGLVSASAEPFVEVDASGPYVRGAGWNEVLDRDYDLVKVDCEGCERYLLEVPCERLRRGKAWVLEVHSFAVDPEALANKLRSCGFGTVIRGRGYLSLLHALSS